MEQLKVVNEEHIVVDDAASSVGCAGRRGSSCAAAAADFDRTSSRPGLWLGVPLTLLCACT